MLLFLLLFTREKLSTAGDLIIKTLDKNNRIDLPNIVIKALKGNNNDTRTMKVDVVLVFLLLTLSRFNKMFRNSRWQMLA